MAIRSLDGYSNLAQVMPAGEKKFASREYIGPADYDKDAKVTAGNIREMAAGLKKDKTPAQQPAVPRPEGNAGVGERDGPAPPLRKLPAPVPEEKGADPRAKGEGDGVGKRHPPGNKKHWKEGDPANKHRDRFLDGAGSEDDPKEEGKPKKPSAAAPPVRRRPLVNPIAGRKASAKGPQMSSRKTYDYHHLKEAQSQRDEAAQLRRSLAGTAYSGDIEGHIAKESQIAGLKDAAAANEAKGVLVDSKSVKYSPPEVDNEINMHNPKSVLDAQKMVDDSLPDISPEIIKKFQDKQKELGGMG